jgi:TP901 family phage tail tape measure protein
MSDFSIVAELQLRGPTGLSQVTQNLQSALRGVKGNVELTGGQAAVQTFRELGQQAQVVVVQLGNTTTAAKNTASGITSLASAMGVVPRQASALTSSVAAASKTLQNVSSDANVASASLDKLGGQAALSTRRFLAFAATGGALALMAREIKNGISAAISFETQMNKIAQVSGDSKQQIGEVATEIGRLSTSYGVASKELANAAVVFKQAGLSAKEVKDNLETLAQADLAPNFKNMTETTEGMIAVMRQFKLDAAGVKEAIGSMNSVAGDFAVEAGDLVEAVKRAGGAFSQTGGQLNELLALFTAVRGTTRESASDIATGLRTIFTRVQRNELTESLRELQINLRYTREEAAQLGNVKLENQFVGAYEAFRRLSEGLKGLSSTDSRKSAIIEQIGGFREVSKVIPLLENFGDAQKALVSAQAGSISTALAAEKAQETLGNRISKVREEFLLLTRSVVESKGFQAFADTALTLANAFIKVADAARPLIPLITAVAAFKVVTSIPTLVGGFNRQFSAASNTLQRRGFASGGMVPGVGDTDSVPAQLTPGEFVVRKQAAQSIGYDRLHQWNRMATGGSVGRPYKNANDYGGFNQLFPDVDIAPAAVTKYASGSRRINRHLIDPSYPHDPSVKQTIGQLNSHIAKSGGIPQNLIVYRGIDQDELKSIGSLDAGKVFQPKSFLSTSTSEGTAAKFAGSEHILRIRAPKGAKGTGIEPILSEDEVLFSPRRRLQILGTSPLDAYGRKGNYIDAQMLAEGGTVASRKGSLLANFEQQKKNVLNLSAADDFWGTPNYASPEQARGYSNSVSGPSLVRWVEAVAAQETAKVDAGPISYNPSTKLSSPQLNRLLDYRKSIGSSAAYFAAGGLIPSRPAFYAEGGPANPFDAFDAKSKQLKLDIDALQERLKGYYTAGHFNNTIDEFHANTGVNLRRGATSLHVPSATALSGGRGLTYGLFSGATGTVGVAQVPFRTKDEVSGTLTHELIHGLDKLVGLRTGTDFGSQRAGSPLAELAGLYNQDVVSPLRKIANNKGDNDFLDYLGGPQEAVAHAIQHSTYGFDTSRYESIPDSALDGIKAFTKKSVYPFLSKITADKEPGLLSLIKPESPSRFQLVEKIRKQRAARLGPAFEGVNFYAKGGSAGTDTVPAMLTPGEFVFNKAAVNKIGLANLREANRTGDTSHIQKFADGGYVRMATGDLAPPATSLSGKPLKDARVSQEFLNAMLERNHDVILSGLRKEFAVEAIQQARLFDFNQTDKQGKLTVVNPDTGSQFSEADVGHPALDTHFVRQITRAAQSAAYKEKVKVNKLNPTDVQGSILTSVAGREGSPADIVADAEEKADAAAVAGATQDRIARLRARQAGVEAKARPRGERLRSAAQRADSGVAYGPPAPPEPPAVSNQLLLGFQKPAGLLQSPDAYHRRLIDAIEGIVSALGSAKDQIRNAANKGVIDAQFVVKSSGPQGALSGPGNPLLLTHTPNLGRFDQVEDAFQRKSVAESQARLQVQDLDSKQDALDARRAGRQLTQRTNDPLAARQSLRDQGVPLAGEVNVHNALEDRLQVNAAATFGLRDEALAQRRRDREVQAGQNQRTRLEGSGLSFSSLGEIAAERSRSEYERLGGKSNLSTETKLGVFTEQRAKVVQELIQAETKHVAIEKADATSAEQSRIARERVAKNLISGNNGAVRDSLGNIVGSQSSVLRNDSQGLQIPTAPGSTIFGQASGALSRFGRFREERLARQSAGSQFALFGATAAAGLVASGLEGAGGSAQGAVGDSTRFSALRGAGGALSGAATGAALGTLALPGWGTAIGAVVGGLTGLYTSLHEASKEIREVKIANALNDVGDRLRDFARVKGSGSDSLVEAIHKASIQTTNKNEDEATHLLSGRNDAEFNELQKRSGREQAAAFVPSIQEGIARQFAEAAKRNPNQSAQALVGRIDPTLVGTLAQGTGTSFEKVQRDLTKQALAAQQGARADQQGLAARTGEERNVNAFNRLLIAVQSASDSLDGLKSRAHNLNDAFDGTVTATKADFGARKLDSLGRPGDESLEPLRFLARSGGVQGQRLASLGQATNDVSSVLSSVISNVFSHRALDANSSDDVTAIHRDTLEALKRNGVDTNSETLRSVLNSVVHEFNEIGKGGPQALRDAGQIDPSKLADRGLARSAEPVREAGKRALELFEQRSNEFSEGLVTLRHRLQTVGETQDRTNSLRVSAVRQSVEFDAQRNFSARSALDQIPLSTLNFPLQARQERLTGLQGAAANNPEVLGRQLAQLDKEVEAATRAQEGAKSRGDKNGFDAAGQELIRLKSRAADTQLALKHLADVSERNAAAFEKIRQLEGDRQARLAFGERAITSGPEEQNNLARGLILANQANNSKGAIANFTPEDARLAFDYLNANGDAKLGGFNGAPRASDLKERLISEAGFGLNANEQKQLEGLRSGVNGNNATGIAASEKLEEIQKGLADKFFTNLGQTQEKFFGRLAQILGQGRLSEAQIQIGDVGKRLSGLRDLDQQRGILRTAGVQDDTQLGNLQADRGKVQALFDARQAIKDFSTQRNRVTSDTAINDIENQTRTGPLEGQLGRFREALKGYGVTDESFVTNAYNTNRKNINEFDLPDGQDRINGAQYRQLLKQSLIEASQSSITGIEKGRLAPAQEALQKDKFSPAAIEEATGRAGGQAQFLAALDSFGSGNTLKSLDENLRATTDQFNTLQQKIAEINGQLGRGQDNKAANAEGFAGGGSIFKSRGSDTVPAMLTPGEFVVNAESAQANKALLHHINNAKGSSYLAKGGVVYLAAGGGFNLPFPGEAVGGGGFNLPFPGEGVAGGGFNLPFPGGDKVGPGPRREEEADRPAVVAPAIRKPAEANAAVDGPDLGGLTEGQYLTKQLRIQAATNPYGASSGFLNAFNLRKAQQARYDALTEQQGADLEASEGDGQVAEAARRRVAARRQLNENVKKSFGGRKGLEAYEQGNSAYNFHYQGAVSNFAHRQAFANSQNQDIGNAGIRSLSRQQELNDLATFRDPNARRARDQYVQPQRFATGGMVGGGDSVPALLTPGEFVLNTSSVARAGAGNLAHFNKGGMVGYLAGGGDVQGGNSGLSPEVQQAFENLNGSLAAFGNCTKDFGVSVGSFVQALTAFSGQATALTDALTKMPRTLTVTGEQRVEVTLNGAEMLTRLTPEIQKMVQEQTQNAIRQVFKDKLPDAGVNV